MMEGFIRIGLTLSLFVALASIGCARDQAVRFGADNSFGGNSSSTTGDSITDDRESSGQNIVEHKLCPVTGEELDSMGGAIPVKANGQTIFVCCQGCVKSVKKDPSKYLAIAQSE